MSETSMSDNQFSKLFAIMITFMFCLTIFLIFLARSNSDDVQTALDGESQVGVNDIITERVEPVGEMMVGDAAVVAEVAVTDNTGGDVAAISGEQVYQASCAACHNSGIAGSPKFGDAAVWTDRIASGIETLYDHAINGFTGASGMMPAKGGNTALSDDGVRASVDYMVDKSQ